MPSGSYGKICGHLRKNNMRCYARGLDKWGGRCREHQFAEGGQWLRPTTPICGYSYANNGQTCRRAALSGGLRCALHTPEKLAEGDGKRMTDRAEQRRRLTNRRAHLLDRITRRKAELAILERDLDKVEQELAELGTSPAERQAAE